MKNDAARSEDDGGTTRSDRDDGFDDDQVDDETLLDSISQLHQHNHLEDNFLRPCHQLDFATSGILLVAKSQAAAGYIMKMFQNRESTVKKTYAAIVVGNIDHSVIDRISSMWGGPDASEDDVRRHLEKLEDSYRRSRFQHSKQKRQQPQRPSHTNQSPTPAKATFRGYQPPHSMYGKWKAEYTAKLKSSASVLSSSSDNKYRQKRKRQHSILSDDDWKFIWEPLRKLLDSSEPIQSTGGKEAWWKLDWKELSRSSRFAPLKEAVVASANRHNDLLREAQIKQRLEESSTPETNIQPMTFPTVFRLKNNDSTKSTVERDGNNDDVFYIYCPLAEDPGSFRMKIPDSDKEVDFSSTSGSFDFKPALTKCRVLERGEYHLPRMSTDDIKGGNVSHEVIAVTKVHLTLFTGRRHQLRVHMATAGFPILGDATYGMKEDMRISNTEYDQRSDNISNSTADLYKGARSEYLNVRLRTMTPAVSTRMCLHALSLRLPLPEDEDWEVFAPDPFHFDRTGVLPLPFRKQSH
jgi:23S rRNA-/tRNA-specific pseudouridylate synthase